MTIPYPILNLWNIAETHGVLVEWYPDDSCPRGRYCLLDGQAFVFLNPGLVNSSMRYRCTFAHELGHHIAGVGGYVSDDERAMRWAYSVVLPGWWLEERLDWDPWRIAEEADVYQEWVEAKLDLVWRERAERNRRKAVLSS